ncbi:hypothetical protein PIGHUM_01130 [Pigmentiphaga humi]|uniref:Uncharacterized protein n=1 Tax=Pigmentiphaga humi TaxID=2478468 RepID=A0A3P4B012_9BURK|nr:hypothetical protein [Pigmentiphaga humi]VCU69070.1 hypothetical protein PIGHUM_01130 [Pigmentiphaga humi]
MKNIRVVVLGLAAGGCMGALGVADGQAAVPQGRGAWADSTHVTGIAQRVMPQIPAASSPVEPDTGPVPVSAPTSISELLERMNGADLYYREIWDTRSGWQELPSILRVQVRADRADIQMHNVGNNTWGSLCSFTPLNTSCQVDIGTARISMSITPASITVTGASCQSWMSGSASAWAVYGWEQYLAQVGAFANQNQFLQSVDNGYRGYFFQSGSFASSCYVEMPG